jgi:hypothetical protein
LFFQKLGYIKLQWKFFLFFHSMIPPFQLSLQDREAINRGVKSTGYIFGYTTNSNAVSSAPPTALDHYFIARNDPDNIYLKRMRQDPSAGCRPGRLLKFRNASYVENQLRCISPLFEKPPHWWKTEPGYQALLHSMNVKPFVQRHETDVVAKTSAMVLILKFNSLQMIFFCVAVGSHLIYLGI